MFASRGDVLLQQPCRACAARRGVRARPTVRAAASEKQDNRKTRKFGGLGDLLGPIGLTLGGKLNGSLGKQEQQESTSYQASEQTDTRKSRKFGGLGDLLGPIGLTLGGKLNGSKDNQDQQDSTLYRTSEQTDNGKPSSADQNQSIHGMTTNEWRDAYEQEGCVDLWVEEEFNSGSRLVGGRAAHKGQGWGIGSGEGPSISNAPRHSVKIHNHHANQELDVEVPEDRFVLWEAEDQGLLLPYACRMGCCTACAVRVKQGVMSQPEALGISKELKDQGFALMCVGYPKSDLVLETVEEDEIYDMQFGHVFNEQAVDPRNKKFIERDDFALEVANMDE